MVREVHQYYLKPATTRFRLFESREIELVVRFRIVVSLGVPEASWQRQLR
jgi:hypothetical protein